MFTMINNWIDSYKKKGKRSFVWILLHPVFIVLVLMVSLVLFKMMMINSHRQVSKPRKNIPISPNPILGVVKRASDIGTKRNRRLRSKRSSEEPKDSNKSEPPPPASKNFTRGVPQTVLDDMLLDAETPLPVDNCLKEHLVKYLDNIQDNAGQRLSEHLEPCSRDRDCLQISSYVWKTEGAGEPCRKKTYLHCDLDSNKCICVDNFDIRWGATVAQNVYQWNPITKTCYVRPTNLCKLEIPCTPGTTCRSTVSIDYNMPPMQTVCECTDPQLYVSADSNDWWYCKGYWHRIWKYDTDNINQWKHSKKHFLSMYH